MLEEILRQDAMQRETAGGGEPAIVPTPVPVPYHGENSLISTLTQEDEKVPEEEEEEEIEAAHVGAEEKARDLQTADPKAASIYQRGDAPKP